MNAGSIKGGGAVHKEKVGKITITLPSDMLAAVRIKSSRVTTIPPMR